MVKFQKKQEKKQTSEVKLKDGNNYDVVIRLGDKDKIFGLNFKVVEIDGERLILEYQKKG